MIKNSFEYLTPESLDEAYELKKDCDDSYYLGGGTDLIPLLKYNVKEPKRIISLEKIMELKEIKKSEDGLFIGSMVPLTQVYENEIIIENFPIIAQAARRVASPQIRNIGTIGGNIMQDRRCMYYNQSDEWRSNLAKCFKTGGNICHQAPKSGECRALYYSDIAPALLSLDVEAVVFDTELRRIPVRELIDDHVNKNGLLDTNDFILKGFFISFLPKNSWMNFEKYSLRASIDFPVMNIAARYSINSKDSIVRIVVGAVLPTPIELIDTEKFILENIQNLKEVKANLEELALSEISSKSKLIRETGFSIKVKRNTYKNIFKVLDDLSLKISEIK